jgi:leucyl aminopeptidase (aminopeptidase T)
MDTQPLARQVVQTSLRIRPDDQVLINTWQHTLSMAEALALECLRANAVPMLQLSTDNLYRAAIAEIAEHTLRKTPQHLLAAYGAASAVIDLSGPENPRIFELGAAGKGAALQEAYGPLFARAVERRVRGAFLQVGFITPERAHKYGADYEEWRHAHEAALSADLAHIAEEGRRVAERLTGTHTVHITHPNGTNLTLECADRAARVDDGVVDDDDAALGNVWVDLPAGSVNIAPVETSAHGSVVFPSIPLWGKIVKELDWEFKQGELIESHAYENTTVFNDFLAGAKASAPLRIGRLGIGLNPKARQVVPGLGDHLVRGAVTVGLGENRDLRGANATGFGWSAALLGATVEVDGKKLVAEGKLMG